MQFDTPTLLKDCLLHHMVYRLRYNYRPIGVEIVIVVLFFFFTVSTCAIVLACL